MSPRPRGSDDAILRATLDLIAEHGVSGLTVDTVAAKAGVGKATIYRHWGSRAGLIRAAIAAMKRPSVEPDTGSLRDDLTILLRHLVEYLDQPDSGRVFTALLDAAARDPELATLRDEAEQEARASFERVVGRAIERGELPGGLDVRLLVDLVISPFVYRRVVTQARVRPAEVAPVVDAVMAAFGAVTSSLAGSTERRGRG